MTRMRAKFRVARVDKFDGGENITFHAVAKNGYDGEGLDENNTFARFTPNATLHMTVLNPELLGQYEEGQEHYADFSAAVAGEHVQVVATGAPRVTPEEVEAAIVGESYTVLPNGRTTVCQLTLDNGFTVEGLSACVCIENFDAEIGQRTARQYAVSQVWQLLGFRLQDRLAKAG